MDLDEGLKQNVSAVIDLLIRFHGVNCIKSAGDNHCQANSYYLGDSSSKYNTLSVKAGSFVSPR